MKTNKQKTKVVSWEANHYTPNNYGVTKSVSQRWWTNFDEKLYDRLMKVKLNNA